MMFIYFRTPDRSEKKNALSSPRVSCIRQHLCYDIKFQDTVEKKKKKIARSEEVMRISSIT